MKIKEISINNFRNYDSLKLNPNKNFNIFYGKNASGKTNILEAISMLISGKSFRTNRDRELLKFDKDSFNIDAIVEIRNLEKDYSLEYVKNRKNIRINLSKIESIRSLRQSSPLITFIPEDLDIINGSPSLRRRFLDDAISNIDQIYNLNIKKYNQILNKKNELLKTRNKNLDARFLFEGYNIQLASLSGFIILKRIEFLKMLEKELRVIHRDISDEGEILKIEYSSPFKDLDDSKKIEREVLEALHNSLEKDLYVKYSTFGLHRDDFVIYANDKPLKNFGSQGQKRSAVLSLKICELKLIDRYRNTSPIILLDDVFSELDPIRREKLVLNLDGYQTFITMSDKRYLDNFKKIKEKNIYKVDNAKVEFIGGN